MTTTFAMLVRNTGIGHNVVLQRNITNIVQTHPPECGTQHRQHKDRSLEDRNIKRMTRIDLAVAIGIFTHWMKNVTMAKTDHNATTMITHHTRMNYRSM